jgi:hypothetical protein
MVFTFKIRGRFLKTGDIIFTEGGSNSIFSMGYSAHDVVTVEDVDHCIIYIGPGGLCVESGNRGVIKFEADQEWRSEQMFIERGLLDNFRTAASVFPSRSLSFLSEHDARLLVRAYVLGTIGKPYNYSFINPNTESAFYCSQLVYHAYRHAAIDLGLEDRWGTPVLPQKVLNHCHVIPDVREVNRLKRIGISCAARNLRGTLKIH